MPICKPGTLTPKLIWARAGCAANSSAVRASVGAKDNEKDSEKGNGKALLRSQRATRVGGVERVSIKP